MFHPVLLAVINIFKNLTFSYVTNFVFLSLSRVLRKFVLSSFKVFTISDFILYEFS